MGIFGAGFVLEHAKVTAKIDADSSGLQIRGGVLTGYVSRPGLIAMVVELQETWRVANPPDYCSNASFLFGEPDGIADLLASLAGGFDSAVVSGVPGSACAGADCNAVSFCAYLEGDGVFVSGVAASPTME